MSTRTLDPAQRELHYRRKLIDIANTINSAGSMQDILVDIKDRVLDLVESERVTIFALDTRNQELFSLFKAGQDVKEIRVPKTFASIAGFVALWRQPLSIVDAYDKTELARISPTLAFDSSWDKKSGFRTTQVLCVPILHEGRTAVGILQLINKRTDERFTKEDEANAARIAKTLGIAFNNHNQLNAIRRQTKEEKGVPCTSTRGGPEPMRPQRTACPSKR